MFGRIHRLRIAFSLPIQAYADGESGVLAGVTYAPPQQASALGDLRLGADVRIFGEYGGAITGAVGLQASLPTGDRDSYAGDGAARLSPRFLLAGDIGKFVYAARLGFQYRAHQATFASSPVGNELQYGLSGGVRVADRRLVIGPELFGAAVTDGDQFFGRRTTPLEALLGAHYTTGELRFGAGVGTGLTRGFGTPVVHALANLEWVQSPDRDRDKDGILDAVDACPSAAGPASSDPAKNGCPVLDRDNDGILDDVDACPNVPGVASSDPAKNGCPVLDRDNDGILDAVDACPDVPGVASSDPAKNGCPVLDRDHDGILDDVDACPTEPGPSDPDPAKNGCPKAFVKNGAIVILDQVRFKTGSAEIMPGKDSEDILLAVLDVLTKHPEIKHLRVEGHTDDRGNKQANKVLSANRAASVVTWLTKHGVDAARLKSAGFGQERPIDTNATDEGRRKNRRVEFHIDEESK